MSAVFPFLLLPILVHNISVENYGILSMAQTLLTIVASFVLFSLPGIAIEFHKKGKLELSSYIVTSVYLTVSGLLLVLLLLFLFKDSIVYYFNIPSFWVFFIPIIVFFGALSQVILTIYQHSDRAIKYGVITVLSSGLVFFIAIILLFIFKIDWESRLYALFIVNVTMTVICFFLLRREGYISGFFQPSLVRKILFFTIPLIPHTLGAALYFMSDRLFISNMLDLESVGYYSAAVQIALVLSIVQDSIGRAWLPYVLKRLSTKNRKNDIEVVEKLNLVKKSYLIFFGVLILGAAYTGFSYLIYKFVMPQGYYEYRFISYWLIISFTLLGMYKVVVPYIWHTERGKYLGYITTLVLFVNIALNYLLIPKYGVLGATYATFISFSIQFIATWYLSNKVYPMPWFDIQILSNKSS